MSLLERQRAAQAALANQTAEPPEAPAEPPVAPEQDAPAKPTDTAKPAKPGRATSPAATIETLPAVTDADPNDEVAPTWEPGSLLPALIPTAPVEPAPTATRRRDAAREELHQRHPRPPPARGHRRVRLAPRRRARDDERQDRGPRRPGHRARTTSPSPATSACASSRRWSTRSPASGRSSRSSTTDRSPRSWSTARTTSTSSAPARSSASTAYFLNDEHVLRIIDRIITPLGRRIDEIEPARRRPPARRLARQRDHRAAVAGRAGHHRPEVLGRRRTRSTTSSGSGRRRPRCSSSCGPASRPGSTSSSPAARAPGKTTTLNVLSSFIPERRADRHDRGRRRAPAPPGARRSRSRRARRTSRARARSRSATCCATRCTCAPTGSSSASVVRARRWTCSRR